MKIIETHPGTATGAVVELTAEEIAVLIALLNNMGGCPVKSYSNVFKSISRVLEEVPISPALQEDISKQLEGTVEWVL